MTKTPKTTPWGQAEVIHPVTDGIAFVTTPSHGGYWLSPDRLAKVPNHWRLARFRPTSDSPWFEEDCDWCLVALTFPEHFPAEAADHAQRVFDSVHAPKIDKFKWIAAA